MKAEHVIRLVVILLVMFLTYNVTRCVFPRVEIEERIERDTIWETKDSFIYIDRLIPVEIKLPPDTVFIPETDEELIALYKALHKFYHTERTYSEQINVDTIGYVYADFRVYRNEPLDFRLGYSLNYPTIVEKHYLREILPYYSLGVLVSRTNLVPLIGIGYDKYYIEVGYNREFYLGVKYVKHFRWD